MTYECLRVEVVDRVAHLILNRPDKRNSMIPAFWRELPTAIREIDNAATARVIVVSAEGPHFTGGLDVSVFQSFGLGGDDPETRLQKPVLFMHLVKRMQDTFSSMEQCRIPVLGAIQGGCIGGGVDMATAFDIRYATKDAYFCIHETNIGMTADVGTFPRIVKLLPEGVVRELAYTGRRMSADEAKSFGLVNTVYEDRAAMLDGVMGIAREIATKAPLAVHGCKRAITHARDHSTEEGLDYVGLWNASMLHAEQIMEAMSANMTKRPGNFVDLPPISDTGPLDDR